MIGAQRRTKLTCPVLALGATQDKLAPPSSVQAWCEQAARFRFTMIEGGHFFVRDSRSEVLALVQDELFRLGLMAQTEKFQNS